MDILTTDAAIPIRTTGRTTDTTVDRHFIGTVVIAFIIRGATIGITGIGNKPSRELNFLWPVGYDSRRLLFSR